VGCKIQNADAGLGSLQVMSLLKTSELLINSGNSSVVLEEKQKLLHDLHNTYMTRLCAAKDQVSVGEWQLSMKFMTCTLCTSVGWLLSGNLNVVFFFYVFAGHASQYNLSK